MKQADEMKAEATAPERHEPPAEVAPLAPGANVPALKKRKFSARPFKIVAPILAAVWLLLAFVTYFPRWMQAPGLSSLYSMAGVTSTEGLMFADVHMKRETQETKTRFILSGSIVNHAAVPRTIPEVYVALNDPQGKAVWTRSYPVNVKLGPGEVYPFRIVNVETSMADSVAVMVLDLGNPLALAMR
jgi:hypothetical protein